MLGFGLGRGHTIFFGGGVYAITVPNVDHSIHSATLEGGGARRGLTRSRSSSIRLTVSSLLKMEDEAAGAVSAERRWSLRCLRMSMADSTI